MHGDEAISVLSCFFSPRLGFCMSRLSVSLGCSVAMDTAAAVFSVTAHASFSSALPGSVWIRVPCVGVCHRSGQGPRMGLGLEL